MLYGLIRLPLDNVIPLEKTSPAGGNCTAAFGFTVQYHFKRDCVSNGVTMQMVQCIYWIANSSYITI